MSDDVSQLERAPNSLRTAVDPALEAHRHYNYTLNVGTFHDMQYQIEQIAHTSLNEGPHHSALDELSAEDHQERFSPLHGFTYNRPYKCEETSCKKLQGFMYFGGLFRHQREVHREHGGPRKPIHCPELNCKRNSGSSFTRKENLHEHIRRVHRRDGSELGAAAQNGPTCYLVEDSPAWDSFRHPILLVRQSSSWKQFGGASKRDTYPGRGFPDARTILTRCHKGLPLLFKDQHGERIVMTTPDSGTAAHHISLELATTLGCTVESSTRDKSRFKLANGKVVESVGRTRLETRFANHHAFDGSEGITECFFNVFEKLAVPILMGHAFLKTTETLTRFKHRLVDLPATVGRAFRICAVDSTENQVSCSLNGRTVIAHADTGAELALASEKFAEASTLPRYSACEKIMLADGSIDYTDGVLEGSLTFDGIESHKVQLHILKNLQFDVLLDEDILDQFDVFRRHSDNFLARMIGWLPILAPIIRLGTVENALASFKEQVSAVKEFFSSSKTENDDKQSGSLTTAELVRAITVLDSQELRRQDFYDRRLSDTFGCQAGPAATQLEVARREAEENQWRADYLVARGKLRDQIARQAVP